MKCSVFVPSHITGFFEIIDNDNPLKKGSRGAGVVMDKGVITKVKITGGKGIKIRINGKKDPKNITITEKTLELLKKDFDLENKKIEIEHEVQVPIGAGFGTSAAFALGTSLGISNILDLPFTFNKAAQIAHTAEIKMQSGLGDLMGEIYGGIPLRIKEGAPGIGIIDKIVLRETDDIFVISKTFGEIKTADIIANPVYKAKINEMGRNLLQQLIRDPKPEKFMELSKKFAENTGLMSNEVKNAIEVLENETMGVSMAMLGNTVFALSKNQETSLDDVIISKINHEGCKFI
ncbi:pantoate kinase [Methanobacterium oryzae]|uniref:pantoate kinase n=1 Tax=Methanobacterium oryzae TaxID=69540 RepID=UPI003D1DCDE9